MMKGYPVAACPHAGYATKPQVHAIILLAYEIGFLLGL